MGSKVYVTLAACLLLLKRLAACVAALLGAALLGAAVRAAHVVAAGLDQADCTSPAPTNPSLPPPPLTGNGAGSAVRGCSGGWPDGWLVAGAAAGRWLGGGCADKGAG